MNTQSNMAPVLKTIIVAATPAEAFDVFTRDIDRWWPKEHCIGSGPARESIIEPHVGGRWYAICEDGTNAVVGHVQVWEPGERFVCSWEISAAWKSDPRPRFTSEVEVRFVAEAPGRTRVELEHRHFERMGDIPGETLRTSVDRGWPAILDLYKAQMSK